MPSDLPIVVLGAGQSSRMRGADKLMQLVDGVPLIRRQAKIARAATSGKVIVALPNGPHPRYGALAGLDIQVLPVPDAAEGMTASLKRGFAAVDGHPAAMLLLADLPELTVGDLREVSGAVDRNGSHLVWRGVTEDGKPGHPIVFAAPLFGAFAGLTGDSGGREVVDAAGDRVHLVPLPGQRARRDLDTPEDWAQWQAERENA